MTSTTFAMSSRSIHAGNDARFFSNLLAPLARAWNDHRLYRRTLAELSALSIRQRGDLGLDGRDLADVARAAVRNR